MPSRSGMTRSSTTQSMRAASAPVSSVDGRIAALGDRRPRSRSAAPCSRAAGAARDRHRRSESRRGHARHSVRLCRFRGSLRGCVKAALGIAPLTAGKAPPAGSGSSRRGAANDRCSAAMFRVAGRCRRQCSDAVLMLPQQPKVTPASVKFRRLAGPRRRSPPSKSLGAAAGMESTDLYPGDGCAGGQARPRPRPRPSASRSRRPTRASSPSWPQARAGRDARRGGRALRGDRGSARPARLLCRPGLCRQHDRSGARQVLRRHAGADDRGLARICCSSRWSSTGIDDAALEAAHGRSRRSAITGPGSRTSARTSPTSSKTASSSCSTRSRSPATRAWNRLFDETMAALRFDVDGEELTLEPTLNLLQDADAKKRKAAAEALAEDLQGQPAALHADHQHARQGQGDLRPLARLQGRRRCRHLANRVEPRGGRCAGRGGARGLSAAVASLLRAEGEMVRQGEA